MASYQEKLAYLKSVANNSPQDLQNYLEAQHDESLADYYYQMPTVGGQQYYSAPDQMSNGAFDHMIGDSQITLSDGRSAIPNDIATQIGEQTNAKSGIHAFLDGPGPVMALGGALGAYGAMGPQGFLKDLLPGFSAPGADASWGVNPRDAAGVVEGAPGSSLLDFKNSLIQQGIMGPEGNLAKLFGSLDAAGVGGLTGIGANLVRGAGSAAGTGLLKSLLGDEAGGALESMFPNVTGASLLEGLLKGGLGYIGADKQADALRDTTKEWLAMGQPSRDRFNNSFGAGFNLKEADPAIGQMWSDLERGASARYGNPAESPSAQGEILGQVWNRGYLPQLNTYRSQNLTGGQLGTNTAGTASLAGANQAGSGLDAIGFGIGTAMSPEKDIGSLLKQLPTGYKLSYGG